LDTLTIIDTSICTDNLGDEIIMDSVNSILYDIFPNAYFFRVPSHERLSDRSFRFIKKSRYSFIGGTNLLSSDINPHGLWRLTRMDTLYLRNAVCMGTGWENYMSSPNRKSRFLLGRVLESRVTHAVRDGYARDRLASIVPNVVNTSCPTMWALTPEHCRNVPNHKSESAVFALTAWRPDPLADRAMIEVIRRNYKKIYFFSQMQEDFAYLQSFNIGDIEFITPTLAAYNRFVENEDVDFIGTRLHGGIRALQKNRRALVIAIDVRAAEIGKDTNLPIVKRGDHQGIQEWIESGRPTDIRLPRDAIDTWKEQFTTAVNVGA